jgi:hypothetical protein
MLIKIIKLNLPAPSKELVRLFTDYVDTRPLDVDNKRWLDEFQDNACNSALHYYSRKGVLPADFELLLNQEYQQYFDKHILSGSSGIIKHTGSGAGCQPPHADRGRRFTINFYVSTGGPEVATVFYDRQSHVATEALNVKYTEVNEVRRTIFSANEWFAFPTDWVHSVENITGCRYFFGIRLQRPGHETYDLGYSFDDFLQDYPGLIKSYL